MAKPSKTAKQIREQLAAAEAAGTRKPAAVQCDCGAWHTPGYTHTEGDTGPTPKRGGA